MKDPWAGKPIVDELLDPGPRQVRSLATARKRAPPEVGDVKVEGQQCTTVSRHRVIRKEAHDRGGTRRPHVEPSLVRQKLLARCARPMLELSISETLLSLHYGARA